MAVVIPRDDGGLRPRGDGARWGAAVGTRSPGEAKRRQNFPKFRAVFIGDSEIRGIFGAFPFFEKKIRPTLGGLVVPVVTRL